MPVRDRYAAAALLLLTVVAYVPAFSAGFVWDDDYYVANNATLRTAGGLWRVWTEPTASPQYYPLVFTTFWAEYRLWGAAPAGYHVTNALLHGANAILAWLVLRRLAVPGAWLAAAVFAAHPVHVESVAWVSERKNVLSGFFYLAAALAYFRYLPPDAEARTGDRRYYSLSVALFVAALLSKTVTCSLPAALLLVAYWKRGRVGRPDLVTTAPLFALGVGFAAVTVWMEKHHVGAAMDWSLTPVERVLVAGRAVWFYAGKLVWPATLTFIYPRWDIDTAAAWQYLFPVAALAVVGAALALRHRVGRGPLVALLFFGGTLLPALGLIDVYPMRFSFVADHFQYLASLGLIALGIAAAVRFSRRWEARHGPALRVLAAGGLAVLAVLTARQARVYESAERLWADTLAKNPACWMAHNNLGNLDAARGRLDLARAHYLESLRLYPGHAEAHNNLGMVLAREGKPAEAVAAFREALRLHPDLPQAHFNAGSVLADSRRSAEALPHLETFLRHNPDVAPAHAKIAVALTALGRMDEAEAHRVRVVELTPDDAQAYYELADLRLRRGRLADAVAPGREAVRLNPRAAEYHVLLGYLLHEQGKPDEARASYQRARAADPNWPGRASQAAWRMAVAPDAADRNGAYALYLATACNHATGDRDPWLLEVKAAALAEVGRFADAAAAARQAIERATATHPAAVPEIRARLQLYESGQPFRGERAPGR